MTPSEEFRINLEVGVLRTIVLSLLSADPMNRARLGIHLEGLQEEARPFLAALIEQGLLTERDGLEQIERLIETYRRTLDAFP